MRHQCWAFIDGGWVLVGDTFNPLAEARALRDDLRAHGIDAEVRIARPASGSGSES